MGYVPSVGTFSLFPSRNCDCTFPEKTPPHVTPAIELSMPSRTAGPAEKLSVCGRTAATERRRFEIEIAAAAAAMHCTRVCAVRHKIPGERAAARRPFKGAQHVCGLSNETRVKERQYRLILKPSIREEIRPCGEI